ncbi:cyclic nucleotide-binding domain-containing protein [Methylobrevis pamukkalensis]|uniref:Cyclic nucleotide-binding domain protein n=1 Tax=Methylobrevis pamukkalensis TaxID=1439726 RepID=A0A1E3H713_9HYPH|nr:cyclic nucleotide-binding domain-containing protein [Methylobrevis pamukkalensis]ODN72110.1 Cyclic nucleotide-binding domain protein [Methylobrevis pamukkalensis]
MSLESDVKMLGRVPLLAEFGEDRLRLVAFSADNRSFADGTRLFAAGDKADAAFVVAGGAVDIYTGGAVPRFVERCGPGRMIDERALLVESRRLADGIAVGDTQVIQIRRQLFRRMLDEYPEIADRLRPHFAARLIALSDSLVGVRARLEALDDDGTG